MTTRLGAVALVLAAGLACQGQASESHSMGPAIDVVFGGDADGRFRATVSGTPRTELGSRITFSGEAMLDYAPDDVSTVRFTAAVDGRSVAETTVDYEEPWPQPWTLVVDPVLACEIDEPCATTVEVTVTHSSGEPGILTAGATLSLSGETALGDALLDDLSYSFSL